MYMYYSHPRLSVLWTYSLTRRAWRTVVACCALQHTTTNHHQLIFRYVFALRLFGMGHDGSSRWLHYSEICHDFIGQVSFYFKYNVVLHDRVLPSKQPNISVSVVFCCDQYSWCTLGPGFPVGPLAPRAPRGPYRDRRKLKTQTKSLAISCTTSYNSLI